MFPRKIVEEPILLDTVRASGLVALRRTVPDEASKRSVGCPGASGWQQLSSAFVSPIHALISTKPAPAFHLSMVLKPFEPPKVFCPTSPNSHDELRQRRAPASDGPPQPTQPTPSTTPGIRSSLFSRNRLEARGHRKVRRRQTSRHGKSVSRPSASNSILGQRWGRTLDRQRRATQSFGTGASDHGEAHTGPA